MAKMILQNGRLSFQYSCSLVTNSLCFLKERGTGELKVLRHKENGSFRIVMRRDKTLKVCANHFITPWMELKASTTNEKAFIYTVMADFADEQSKSECLAVKFATEESEFYIAFLSTIALNVFSFT